MIVRKDAGHTQPSRPRLRLSGSRRYSVGFWENDEWQHLTERPTHEKAMSIACALRRHGLSAWVREITNEDSHE